MGMKYFCLMRIVWSYSMLGLDRIFRMRETSCPKGNIVELRKIKTTETTESKIKECGNWRAP